MVPTTAFLEKAMAPHSSTLAWKIPWTEKPGRLQSMGLLRVRHDWATSLSRFTFMHWKRKRQPTPVFLPGESQGRGSQVGCRLWGHRVGQDWSDLAAAASSSRGSYGYTNTATTTKLDFFLNVNFSIHRDKILQMAHTNCPQSSLVRYIWGENEKPIDGTTN